MVQMIAGAGVFEHRGVVAGGLDRVDEVTGVNRRVVVDVGLLDHEVHGGPHPVEAVEATFDLRGAGGTGHPAQPQIRGRHNPDYTPRGYMYQ